MALRSPSRERRASVSSRSSPASNEMRSRRKIDTSPPPLADYSRPILDSPPPYKNDDDDVDADLADRRNKRIKRKDKKHKRDRKSKKKKKRSKHHSRSTSVDSSDSAVNAATAHEHHQEAVLSDWETAPSTAAATTSTTTTATTDKIDTSACSPVSNDSHIASPDEPPPPVDEVEDVVRGRGRRTPPASPPVALLRGEVPMRESPHTPPLLPPGRGYGMGARERSLSPMGGLGHERERGGRLGYVLFKSVTVYTTRADEKTIYLISIRIFLN